ncbi:Mannosyl-oligosaccharide 1,2-alpha-mannosidase MNS1 [Auxenochlorella protothecoides]|uniref:alpha-1,2-Mannosidase n=2 Tax=Auxenochlorella protothecoides TaxID=3075 RepID=A0A087SAW1_AUXPR|nr:Mannosyl-oligosaccharide 1,2-alpha-mannosidase MNS1 [Auxenochlorella protothecoides]KFM22865.1 Mannosyl-oligosaccharide 1,2-alpha-mannosidase MNS1 [Auxenochlorella protothecoides]
MLPGTGGGVGTRRRDAGFWQGSMRGRRGTVLAIATLVLLGGGWSLFLYSNLVDAEESSDLHLHVEEGRRSTGEGGLRQRLALLEEGIRGLASAHLEEAADLEARAETGSAGEGLTLRQKVFVEGEEVAEGSAQSPPPPVVQTAQEVVAQAVEASRQAQGTGGEPGRPDLALEVQKAADAMRRRRGAEAAEKRRQRMEERLAERARAAVPLRPRRDPPNGTVLTPAELTARRKEVEDAMLHAWQGYVTFAWGHDELCPISQTGKDDFGGLGATIVDSLDTLRMMGFTEEYERALGWVRSGLNLTVDFNASVFETTIRVVGGFLAAYELTGDEVLLKRSLQVAERLLPAYDTPTGIPYGTINLKTLAPRNPKWASKASSLAEFGTHQLEWYKLSALSGDRRFADLAEHSIRYLNEQFPGQGLMPLFLSPSTGKFTSRRISLGALGDSYYEYLLKMWLLKGKTDDMYRTMWEQAMDEMLEKLVLNSTEGHMYIAELDRKTVRHKMDHLVCFVPGMLALGVHSGAVGGEKGERYMAVAAGVTETCWHMYDRQASGLSPEIVTFRAGGAMRDGGAYNLLRPEAVEAFWYMWRVTRDWKYRDWGWAVFQTMQRHGRKEAGFSGVKDVREAEPTPDDTQQSFVLAETFKYLWLLFSEDTSFDFETTVLNTEAHPLKVVRQPLSAADTDTQR